MTIWSPGAIPDQKAIVRSPLPALKLPSAWFTTLLSENSRLLNWIELAPMLGVISFERMRSVKASISAKEARLSEASAERDEAGRLYLHLRDRPERLAVSRLYAPLFKAM